MPKNPSLWTATSSSTDIFGNVHAYEKQLQRIIIELLRKNVLENEAVLLY